MSPSKKRKRPDAAQQLIDSLLDENSSDNAHVTAVPKSNSKSKTSGTEAEEGNFVSFNLDDDEYGKTPAPQSENLFPSLDLHDDSSMDLSLETSEPVVLDPVARAMHTGKAKHAAPPFKGGSPVVTQMAGRPEPQLEAHEDLDGGEAGHPHSFENSHDEGAEYGADVRADDEPTMRLVVSNKSQPRVDNAQFGESSLNSFDSPQGSPAHSSVDEDMKSPTFNAPFDRGASTEIRSGIKVPPPPKAPSSVAAGVFSSSEAGLKTSESLRIAQARITELEQELERVRRENESLSTAGDTLRRRADELLSKAEALEIQAREATRMLDEEKKVMRGQLQAKDRDNAEMRARVEEIETRLESNFKKIRVRERELEHRLEIVKMESTTLVSTKDKMILDLKRQIDQLNHEHDYAKTKTQELFSQYKDKQETQRRVVRALRIALTILEGDDESVAPLKKAE